MQEHRVIDASVSKSFFVDMLVKDISLPMAIHDLIDNCIDGAKRLRGEGPYNGLRVEVSLRREEFSIRDNCGGIDLETAEHYAFRFGRPEGAPRVAHSVGQFGVGMKRALFKLGRRFIIRSTSSDSLFEVDVDVNEWEQSPEWNFEFARLDIFENASLLENRGTLVKVDSLMNSVAEKFDSDAFVRELWSSIAYRHYHTLQQGLRITVNGRTIAGEPVEFMTTPGLRPQNYEWSLNGLTVRQIVGIGRPRPSDAGWYVYCNGRLVLRADQSEATGWGEAGIDRIPKYHNQFAMFRGCVLFDSDDPGELPWNTTKDGVDIESQTYQLVRQQMVTDMKPVIAMLRDLGAERDLPQEDQITTGLVSRAATTSMDHLDSQRHFVFDKPPRPVGPRLINVHYKKPQSIVRQVQTSLQVTSASAAGERTFDYYVELEMNDG